MSKLEYRFRIHDADELDKILKSHILKNRKIGVTGFEKDFTYDEFLDWVDLSDRDDDFMIRVYFNSLNPSLKRFQRKVRGLLKKPICGNFHCSQYECNPIDSFCPFTTFANEGNDNVEYLWRCIYHDEKNYAHDEDF